MEPKEENRKKRNARNFKKINLNLFLKTFRKSKRLATYLFQSKFSDLIARANKIVDFVIKNKRLAFLKG